MDERVAWMVIGAGALLAGQQLWQVGRILFWRAVARGWLA